MAGDDGRNVRNDGSRRQSGGGVAIALRVLVRDSRESLRVALLLEGLVETPEFLDFTRRNGISTKLTQTQLSRTPVAYNGDGILLNGGQGSASGGSSAGGAGGNQVIVKVAGGIYISYDLAIGLGVGLGTFFLCSCAAACAIINRRKIRRYLSSAEEREEARDKMQESVKVWLNVFIPWRNARRLTPCVISGLCLLLISFHGQSVSFLLTTSNHFSIHVYSLTILDGFAIKNHKSHILA